MTVKKPSRLSNLLWTFGSGLLHSGIVINDKEYAYGGHNRLNTTGVYYTKPRYEPPGGTHRCSLLAGYTSLPSTEIEKIIKQVSDSEQFLGERYNLLTNNCNHFTHALCLRLSGKGAPAWLNRAAGIGLAMPCMVPREWVVPPDVETAEGELVDEGEEAAMLEGERRRERREVQRRRGAGVGAVVDIQGGGGGAGSSLAGGRRIEGYEGTPPPRLVTVRDTSGREMPVAERAPMPKR
ncbi:hypothetical protein LTR62_000407 [Meristemomyces frigidus]|uniref:PPPDE domain-containing protein n=1 Tax=Meristemomyces frigidus TaxID=1508187 RepID=A0AAN7YIG0_9PEZI|nr:hypothetical protein LTR62_000407 [Meristemomyces frigidus]